MELKRPMSVVLMLKNKNRRFFLLAKDFFKSLSPFCISGLTKNIEQFLCIDIKSIRFLRLSHIWIFSQRRLSLFIHFSSIFSGRFLSLEVFRFVLKKEFSSKRNLKNRSFSNIFLFLNNVSEKTDLGIFINKQLRDIIPIETDAKKILGNNSKCLLFDFNDSLEILEFRCYSIANTTLLLPRKIRKRNKMKKIARNNDTDNLYSKNSENERSLANKNSQEKNKNIVRIIEIGPRISAKILN